MKKTKIFHQYAWTSDKSRLVHITSKPFTGLKEAIEWFESMRTENHKYLITGLTKPDVKI